MSNNEIELTHFVSCFNTKAMNKEFEEKLRANNHKKLHLFLEKVEKLMEEFGIKKIDLIYDAFNNKNYLANQADQQ